jgi:hypothetical protein
MVSGHAEKTGMTMKKPSFRCLLITVFFSLISVSLNADEQLKYYGTSTINDSSAAVRLRSRFQASGTPVFLINNVRIGLTKGDILRFADKAVLIDGNVWQTLKNDSILQSLPPVKILAQRAGSASSYWKDNSVTAKTREQINIFALGSRLLNVFENDFNGIPDSQGIFLQFNGKDVVLAAPAPLLKNLKPAVLNKTSPIPEKIDSAAPLSYDTLLELLVNPPWDTLVCGRRYSWNIDGIVKTTALHGIFLDSVSGNDSIFLNSSEIICIPQSTPMHLVRMFFVKNDSSRTRIMRNFIIPVKSNQPPAFVSKTGGWQFETDQEINYTPAAIDPENDNVSITQCDKGYKSGLWNGKNFVLKTSRPGTYSAEFLATDDFGNSSSQMIAWEVPDTRNLLRRAVFESKSTDGYNLLKFYYANRRVRAGVLTPVLNKILNPEAPNLRHMPYVFIGCNILNSHDIESPEYLFVDFGITARTPHEKLVTGGLFFSVSNRLIQQKPFPFVSEFEFSLSINQLIIIADTSGIVPEFENREEVVQYLDSLQQHADEYNALARAVLGESVDAENATALLRFEALTPVWKGFSAGPVFWSTIQPFKNRYDQILGLSLRYSGIWRMAGMEQTLRAGTGGSKNPFCIWWDISTSLGRQNLQRNWRY